jgi:hypothetical protein
MGILTKRDEDEEYLCEDGKPCTYKYVEYQKVCRHGLCEDRCPLDVMYYHEKKQWKTFMVKLKEIEEKGLMSMLKPRCPHDKEHKVK